MKIGIVLLSMLSAASAFAPSFLGTKLSNGLSRSVTSSCLEMKYTIVLVRHGESTWNDENRLLDGMTAH